MLYSIRDKGWKVADFGLTVEGASNRALSTHDSKGTPGYRAPELIRNDDRKRFTNKCDIWAIGVILYELIHREKPFADDYAVQTYYERLSHGQSVNLPIKLSEYFQDENTETFLVESLQQTLSLDPSSRPPARELTKRFKNIFMEMLSDAVGAVSIEKACRDRQHLALPEINLQALRTFLLLDLLIEGEIGSQRPQLMTHSGPLDSRQTGYRNVRGGRMFSSQIITQNLPLDFNSLLSQLALPPRPQLPDNAIGTLESTLDIRKRTLGVQHPTTLKSMKTLAERYFVVGMSQKAVDMYLKRAEAASEAYKPNHPAMLLIKNDLALAYSKVAKFEDAARIGEELCEKMIGVWAPEDFNFLTMRYNLGYYYEFTGKLIQAAELYEDVIEKGQYLKGDGNDNMLLAMIGLESVYGRMGRVSDAVRICSEVIEIKAKVYGEDHASTLQDMNVLVQYYKRLRRYSEAVTLTERIVSIRTRTNGAEHAQTLSAKAELAAAYISDKKFDKAQELLRETLPIRQRIQGEEHPETLQNMDDLCLLENRNGYFPAEII